jgi:hypothetical protein
VFFTCIEGHQNPCDVFVKISKHRLQQDATQEFFPSWVRMPKELLPQMNAKHPPRYCSLGLTKKAAIKRQ